MPEYLAPGVYVEEVEMGAKPIEGVSTSTAGFIGTAERGPVSPKLVTGFEQYRRVYGGFIPGSYLPYAVDGFFANGGKRCFISRVMGKGNECASLIVPSPGRGPAPKAKSDSKEKDESPAPKKSDKKSADGMGGMGGMIVRAVGPGTWGDRVAVKIEKASLANFNPELFKMTVIYWKEPPPSPVVDPTGLTQSRNKDLREPAAVEVYDNLTAAAASSDNVEKRINGISSLVEVEVSDRAAPGEMELTLLSGGDNGAPVSLEDYKGRSSTEEGSTGLASFSEVDEISILCAPNENDVKGLTDALIAHCELLKDRFAVLQVQQNAGPVGELYPRNDSKYAALYYPWIKVMDHLTRTERLIPPGGHITGIYARSDIERGVHKAPANEVVRGVMGLQFPVGKGKQDILNPRGVNCIRTFRGRGIRVWGARTVSSDPIWKYINVRRLFLYLEESIDEGTQWVVFEPNDEKLWNRVKQTVGQFLTRVWKDGALMGLTPEEAFFVKCDRTTMTQDDIDNGRLIVLIGVAPVKPAEFVIFRIAQWQGGSAVNE